MPERRFPVMLLLVGKTMFLLLCCLAFSPVRVESFIANNQQKHSILPKSLFGISAAANGKVPLASTVDDTDAAEDAAALRSITFSNLPKDQEPQLLCNFLMELSACSTSITDADAGTDEERALFHEVDLSTWTTANTTAVWDMCDVQAQFPASTDLAWILDIVKESFPTLPDYTLAKVENKDWVLHVQKSWKPTILDPFVLRFPWHTDAAVQEALVAAKKEGMPLVEMELQGGIAFGTGEHPTTQMCLEWIAKTCKPGMNVMDYGAGSGVLGMAACKLDPSIKAVGVDIDVDAVQIANANSKQNNVPMINYLSDLLDTKDNESKSILMKAYSSKHGAAVEVLPDECNGPIYDACVANILAGPLVTLVEPLAKLIQPNGGLGLSGIMSSQAEMIIEAYSPLFDNVKVEKELNGWVLITGTRKA